MASFPLRRPTRGHVAVGSVLALVSGLSGVAGCGSAPDAAGADGVDSGSAGDSSVSDGSGGDTVSTTDTAPAADAGMVVDGGADALGPDAPWDSAGDVGADASSDAPDGDAADGAPAPCATCQKMNAKPVVFGGSVVRYAVLEPTRLFWTASTSRDDNSTIWSLERTATLGAPVDHKAYAYTKRDLTYHDRAFYWFDKAADSTYISVGRLTLATDVSEHAVFYTSGGFFMSLEYGGIFSDGSAPLLYGIAKDVYTLATGAAPGPAGAPLFSVATGHSVHVSGADAASYYGSWDWGGGSYGYSLARIDRTTKAMTEMVNFIGAPTVLFVYGGEVYYQSYSSAGVQVLHVGKDVITKTTGTVVAAIPPSALVYPVAPSNLCWAEEGKSNLHCLDLATSAVTDRSTGPLLVDAVVGDDTNHYFFSRAPGTFASDWLFDVYRVAK